MQAAQSKNTKSGKKLLEYEEFCQMINSGQCICSYTFQKGESKGKICGAKVKEVDQSLPGNQQKCTAHVPKDKASKGGNVPSSSFPVSSFNPGFGSQGGFIQGSFPTVSP